MRWVACALVAGCSFRAGQLRSGDDDAAVDVAVIDSAAVDGSLQLDAPPLDASIDAPPAVTVRQDCLDWFQNGVTTSGLQMIDPDGGGAGAPFQAYCDMVTAGGGWTLVWVYGFTSYSSFTSSANAVTPRPTWGGGAGTPTSTTVPLAPTTQGALEFARWPQLGANFLFESNINQWVACVPGTGSLVTGTAGTLTCTVQMVITASCTTTVPDRLGSYNADLGLWAGTNLTDTYDYWDGSTTANWPTHDPCGNNGANQKTGVGTPYGSIYLRR